MCVVTLTGVNLWLDPTGKKPSCEFFFGGESSEMPKRSIGDIIRRCQPRYVPQCTERSRSSTRSDGPFARSRATRPDGRPACARAHYPSSRVSLLSLSSASDIRSPPCRPTDQWPAGEASVSERSHAGPTPYTESVKECQTKFRLRFLTFVPPMVNATCARIVNIWQHFLACGRFGSK